MKRTEISRRLRPYRRALVLAAEQVLADADRQGRDARAPSKTQFSRLINLCGEATCSEELENYLRYQAGRAGRDSKDAWRMKFVDLVLQGIRRVLDESLGLDGVDAEQRDLCRVEAWRLYATYLARAFTYQEAVRRPPRPRGAEQRH